MAVRFAVSADGLARGTGPGGGTYTATWWARRRVSTSAVAQILLNADGTHNHVFRTDAGGAAAVFESDQQGGSLLTPSLTFTIDTWYYCAFTFTGGTALWQILASGGTSFTNSVTQTGLAALGTINDFRFCNSTALWNGEVASAKVWAGVALSTADLLSERLYRNPQTNLGSVWATYQIKSGALGIDSSGNGRPLTEVGTLAFVADPSDILGDSATPVLDDDPWLAPLIQPPMAIVSVWG